MGRKKRAQPEKPPPADEPQPPGPSHEGPEAAAADPPPQEAPGRQPPGGPDPTPQGAAATAEQGPPEAAARLRTPKAAKKRRPQGPPDDLAWVPETLRRVHGEGRVAVTAYLLGTGTGLGVGLLLLALHAPEWWLVPVGLYLLSLAVLHQTEYLALAVLTDPQTAAEESIVNRGRDPIVALMCSWVEVFAKCLWCPAWQGSGAAVVLGALLMGYGHYLRLSALASLKADFAAAGGARRRDQRLCTSGPYRRARHPAYRGAFWWTVGSQVLLQNPVCLVAFTGALWRWCRAQIAREEAALASPQYFGDAYVAYRRRVATGIPFIR